MLNITDGRITAKIVSDTPGRLRLRILPSYRDERIMQNIVDVLKVQSDIREVKINVNSGSMLVHYDPRAEIRQNLLAAMVELGVNFRDMSIGNSQAAEDIKETVINLNQLLGQLTNGEVDLRLLFPLSLSILAIRQGVVKGLQVGMIPWYVLAWYAFDSFIRFNSHSDVNIRRLDTPHS